MVKVLKPRGGAKGEGGAQKGAAPGKADKAAEYDLRAEALRTLSQFQLGEMDLRMRMRQMSMTMGEEPTEWMAALEILRDNIIKTEHPDLKLRMYQAMVDLLAKVGRKDDLFIVQQIIARYNLKSFKDIGFERVEVECAKDACPTCQRMAGKRFRIDEAMETMPIPCRDCTTEVDAVKGYCRCRYFAIL